VVFGLVASLVLLAVVLTVAVFRPRRLPESSVAVGAAALLLLLRVVSPPAARDELHSLAPILIFLAAVLVLGACCASEGLFTALGDWLAGGPRSPRMLLLLVFGVAAGVTCVLSLDATVVLLTPVVLAAGSRLELSPSPYVYATGHVANSGSLLLPTGNLTNLLALSAAGLTWLHFAALMALPWLCVLIVEYAVLRTYFRSDLTATPRTRTDGDAATPWVALAVLALTLDGFVVTSVVGIESYWAAVGGAAVLALHALITQRMRLGAVVRAVNLQFVLFVMGLAVVVRAAVDNGVGDAANRLVPASASFGALLAIAALAAVLANVVNNLPAVLILLPSAAQVGSLAVLAVLIGVNLGPNLTYPGSLATLLWRGVLRDHGLSPSLRRFTVLGLLTVPPCLLVAVAALWIGGQM
jgi:arsenical pump membrane protein